MVLPAGPLRRNLTRRKGVLCAERVRATHEYEPASRVARHADTLRQDDRWRDALTEAYPAAGGSHPAIIFVHGGGFEGGASFAPGKQGFGATGRALARLAGKRGAVPESGRGGGTASPRYQVCWIDFWRCLRYVASTLD